MTYAPEHEKELFDRPHRRRMGVHRATPSVSQQARTTEDPRYPRDPRRDLLLRPEKRLPLAATTEGFPPMGDCLLVVREMALRALPVSRVNKGKNKRKGRRRHRPHRHRFYHAPSATRSPRRLRQRGRGKPYLLIVVVPGLRLAALGLAGSRTAANQFPTTVLVALARVPLVSAPGFRPRKRDQRTHDSSGNNCKRPSPGDGVVSQTARQLV